VTPLEALGIFAAGIGAGTINTVVGSGSLITFPVLVAFGYPPVVANVSNTIGIVSGSITGAIGYRQEMAGQGRRLLNLSIASAIGALIGGLLLLRLPADAFTFIVPILIAVAVALIIAQPWLNRWTARRRAARAASGSVPRFRDGGPLLLAGVLCSGVYGGYFGAAQGVILIGLLGVFINESLQRVNAAKNVAAAVVNGVAAILFVFVAPVAWDAVAVLAVGSVIGGVLGSVVGRRLPPLALRVVVIAVGVYAAAQMLV
jgi:hypothetical protein